MMQFSLWLFLWVIANLAELSSGTFTESGSSELKVTVEYLSSPLALNTTTPRVSWRVEGLNVTVRDEIQTSYKINVASSKANLRDEEHLSYNSGNVTSNMSQLVPLQGLQWGKVYYVQVAISTTKQPLIISAAMQFSIAPETYKGKYIGLANSNGSECPWLRTSWTQANWNASTDLSIAYIGSFGYHELYINGQKVSEDVLAPAVSDLAKRVLVRPYDISKYVTKGTNTIGIWLGPGWTMFSSVNPKVNDLFNATNAPLVLGEVQIIPENGETSTVIATDETWKASQSDTVHIGAWHNSDFGGDLVDTRLSIPNWSSPSFDDSKWQSATIFDLQGRRLQTDLIEPTQKREIILADFVNCSKSSVKLCEYKMEQVFTGWVHVSGLQGTRGTVITIRASTTDLPNGVAQYNMEHQVILGDGSKSYAFEPRFSYHEVLFLEINGSTSTPVVTGYRVGNIVSINASPNTKEQGRQRRAWFHSSDSDLNTIYNVSLWTMANLVTGGISVDCPHRERLGYIGDAHTTLETALINTDAVLFYKKWLYDIIDIQGYPAHTAGVDPTGYIPHTAPTIDGGGGPGWSGFVVVMPWQVYMQFEDLEILQLAYPHQKQLISFWNRSMDNGLFHAWNHDNWAFLGDWLTPHGSEGSFTIEAQLFNANYALYCVNIVQKVANILGYPSDANEMGKLAKLMEFAINAKFYNPANNTYLDSLQTHLIMPLVSGAANKTVIERALRNEIVNNQAGHIDTGLHGTYFLTKYLTDTSNKGFGHQDDLLYTIAKQSSHPGYLSLLSTGYTTWPEAWGTCFDKPLPTAMYKCKNWQSGSASLLHGTLNGLGQWFVSGVGGIRRAPSIPGYQETHFHIPNIPIESAMAKYDSMYGMIENSWMKSNTIVAMNCSLPTNTKGIVFFPINGVSDWKLVKESGNPATHAEGVHYLGTTTISVPTQQDRLQAMFAIGSGNYNFFLSK
eukprot:m.60515 g.60515  ORF g.60515 m.60515 type:complete len:960 (-) comp11329_c0_seq1:22-2901(-)